MDRSESWRGAAPDRTRDGIDGARAGRETASPANPRPSERHRPAEIIIVSAMTNVPTNAGSAEVISIDLQARGPLLLLVGSAIVWLVISGVLAVITSIQLHSPGFLADCPWFTYGRAHAMRESAFIYGWAANAGLGIALWVMARLGGYPLRA